MTVEEAAFLSSPGTVDSSTLGMPEENPLRAAGPAVRFRRKDMERFVSQNIHGRSEDRESTGLAQGRSATAGYQESVI